MEVTGSELARQAGVSRQAVSKAMKQNQIIRSDGKMFDLSDATNKSWLQSRKNASGVSRGSESNVSHDSAKRDESGAIGAISHGKGVKKTRGGTINDDESKAKEFENKKGDELSPVELEELLGLPAKFKDMTLEQMVLQFGHYPGMKGYAELLDKLMSGLKKSVEIQKIKHELIERTFFVAHVKVFLDLLSEQLFDYAGTDKNAIKDFEKMINHAQQNIDRELGKMQKLQEAAVASA